MFLDPVIAAAALRDAQTMIRSYRGHSAIAYGTNNTELIRQLGALGASVRELALGGFDVLRELALVAAGIVLVNRR